MDFLQTINKPIEKEITDLNDFFKSMLKSDVVLMNDALSFLSESIGKMMRPTLVLLVAKSIGNINECYVEVAVLEPNRKYSLIVKNVKHSNNLEMPENYEIYKTLKTLKQSPTFGTTSVVVNKLSSKFLIYLNSIKDPYNSVTSYRADIYPSSQINNPEAVVARREAPASGQIEIGVDDNIIKRNTSYQAN